MLIPMFIIIGVWGGPNRVYATIKFFLYTFLGSVFMLLGLIYLYLKGQSLQLADMQAMSLNMGEQTWLFFAFLVAFAVKIPMWPVHTWLPDAHVEAPTSGSMVLAAVMLKVGGYGFLRFSMPIAPDASAEYAWVIIALSLIAVVYIGFVALAQEDMKKLIAYSSISHMGFVTLGLFIAFALVLDQGATDMAALGVQGAMVQMIYSTISHVGFILLGILAGNDDGMAAAMFYAITYSLMSTGAFGMIIALSNAGFECDRIDDFKGLNARNPWLAFMMLLIVGSLAGFPPLVGFFAKLYVLQAAVNAGWLWLAIVAVVMAVVGAYYYLRLIKAMYFDEAEHEHVIQAPFDLRVVLTANGLLQLGLTFFVGSLTALCVAAWQ